MTANTATQGYPGIRQTGEIYNVFNLYIFLETHLLTRSDWMDFYAQWFRRCGLTQGSFDGATEIQN